MSPRHERLLTVGHGTLPADGLATLLKTAGVTTLVDVRSYPASRRHPHVARDEIQRWLPEHGIDYAWEPRLGGRRTARTGTDVGLRVEGFRGYAEHMRTEEFSEALDQLLDLAGRREGATAVMCAESVWWRCHRRLLADALVLLRGVAVAHLFHDGRTAPHQPTDVVRVEDGLLHYDAGADRQLPGVL